MKNCTFRPSSFIAGVAGFLGSNLSESLLTDGHVVICLDNFSFGAKSNDLSLLVSPHFDQMRHDVTFPLYAEVEEIYSLACLASQSHYSGQTAKTSLHGAINLRVLTRRTKTKIFNEGDVGSSRLCSLTVSPILSLLRIHLFEIIAISAKMKLKKL